jgi:hypothetical protein
VYERQVVLDTVEGRFATGAEPDASRWDVTNVACTALGPDAFLVTYELAQGERATRRVSIWRLRGEDWQIV